jgi:outer membrane protein assembly factor BamE (lipoprotein component of BamABCDE complex)
MRSPLLNFVPRMLMAAVAAAALAGCAGTDFQRPDSEALRVGTSTLADVKREMGQPMQTGESLRNGEKLAVSRYAYANTGGGGTYPGVVPARAMVFITHKDVLVADEFVSSFAADTTEFDDSKTAGIVKGKSTRADVVALLGKPHGAAVYPYIKNKGDSAALYSYAHAKGSVFNMKFYNKTLVVSFDGNDVVSDVEFSSTGEK